MGEPQYIEDDFFLVLIIDKSYGQAISTLILLDIYLLSTTEFVGNTYFLYNLYFIRPVI